MTISFRLIALYCILPCIFAGCGKPVVVRAATSTDKMWKAEVAAVRKFPLGTIDAELWLSRDEKRIVRKVLFGGMDTVQDVEAEIIRIEIIGSNVVVTTRGTFGPSSIEQSFTK